MRRVTLIVCFLILTPLLSQASWYWPFTSGSTNEPPRLSELMKPATTNIDAAADFAAEGKVKEAQECYRAAIAALERIERENPERAATPEFATVRNKRAYINAALDAMLLEDARQNAKAVAVTDTTALEVRLVRKPWPEIFANYTTLTNADDILMRRIGRLDATRRAEVAPLVEACVPARDRMNAAEREAELALARVERFAETASSTEGARVFDVCKKDARKAIRDLDEAWPEFGEKLAALAQALGEETALPEKEDDRGLVKNDSDTRPEVESQLGAYVEAERQHGQKVRNKAERVKNEKAVKATIDALLEEDAGSRKARLLQSGEYLRRGDLVAAKAQLKTLIDEKPDDWAALNMRAAIETAEGDLKAAEKTLDLAIRANPREYHAYYNMASVYLGKGNVEGARRYYETGRSFAGPVNEELEKAVMER